MEMLIDRLYARDSKRRIKEWSVKVRDEWERIDLIVSHGLLGGTTEHDMVLNYAGKNIGKSNATTPLSQAILDAKSRANKKRREGYKSLEELGIRGEPFIHLEALLEEKLPKDNSDKDGNIIPMKCQKYDATKIHFPVLAQPKLNGFRCVAKLVMRSEGFLDFPEVVFLSKKGLEYKLPHIAKEFLPEDFEMIDTEKGTIELVLDGEMYCHGMSLQDISSAVRKPNKDTPRLVFYVFDVAIPNTTQDQRIDMLELLGIKFRSRDVKTIKIVETTMIHNDADVQVACEDHIVEGYEGVIVRDMDAHYAFGKRPKTIMKLKRSQDAEFQIIDVVLSNQSDKMYSVLKLKNDINDLTFESTPEGSLAYRASLFDNREELRGKMATVSFFERTNDGIPFHSKVVVIRDYE